MTFNANANYEVYVQYVEPRGLTGSSETLRFVVDKDTKPTGSVTIGGTNTWSTLLEKLTFGLWTQEAVTVSATAQDEICTPAPKIEYFKTSDTSLKLRAELEEYADWQEFHEFEVSKDEVFVIYLKITDAAGNYDFISSNGYILDSEDAEISIVAKESANENGYYNKDVPILIDINEKADATYSGIKSIEYWVENNGNKTRGETLLTFESLDPTYAELESNWNSDKAKKEVVADAEKNNSDDVKVYVKVVDNAGNENTKTLDLKIDATKPKIQLSYDVDNGNKYTVNSEQH